MRHGYLHIQQACLCSVSALLEAQRHSLYRGAGTMRFCSCLPRADSSRYIFGLAVYVWLTTSNHVQVEPLLGSAASAPRSGPDSFPLESVDGEASEDGPMMTPKRTRGDAAPVMMMQDGGDGDADAATREGYVVLGSAMMAGAAAAESAVPPQVGFM